MIFSIILFGVGGLLLLAAYLVGVKGMYNLISGINTATPQQKTKMNLPAICKTFGIGMAVIGGVFLLCGVMTYLGLEWAAIAAFGVLLAGMWYMICHLQRYDGNNYKEDGQPKKRYYAVIGGVSLFMIATCSFVAVLFAATLKSPEVILTQEGIEIRGMYGTEIPKEQIMGIERVSPPAIALKTNGSAVFEAYKGYFTTEEYGPALIYARQSGGEWIVLPRTEGEPILLSLKAPEDTSALYEELLRWLGE